MFWLNRKFDYVQYWWNWKGLIVYNERKKLVLIIFWWCFSQVIGVMSVFFICVSILTFCLKTHPNMRVPVIRNITVKTSSNTEVWVLDKTQTNPHEAFFYIECVCNAWFTVEILIRFISSPSKFVFIRGKSLSKLFIISINLCISTYVLLIFA